VSTPKKPQSSTKADRTTAQAWKIIDEDKAKQDAKTARLKRARLDKEAAEASK
jgi:hypothetical protein